MFRPARVVLAVLAVAALAVPTAASAQDRFRYSRTLLDQPAAGHPQGAAVDAAGNVFVADTAGDVVRRIAPDGTSSVFAGAEVGTPLNDPYGIVIQPGGGIDVTDRGDGAVKRFDAGGALLSQFDNGIGFTPTGIVRTGDSGLIVADAGGQPQLFRYTGGPEASLGDDTWRSVGATLPGKPADLLLLSSDRLVVTFPEQGRVAMYDAATGGQPLATFDNLPGAQGLTVLGGDLLVGSAARNNVLIFPGLASSSERTFPTPRVMSISSGSVEGIGCLFDTSALMVTHPPSFGVCNHTSTPGAESVDLFEASAPSPRTVLTQAAIDLRAGGQFQCSPIRSFGVLNAVACGRAPSSQEMHGVGGGALAALLLAAGGGVAAAIIAGNQNDDFNFGGSPVVIRPLNRLSRPQVTAAAAGRRVTVHLEAGSAIKLTFKASAATRRAVRRALRTHRRVYRTLVITVRDKTHGKTYTIKRKLTFRRPHGAK